MSSWLRVAAGLQKVASAAASHAAQESQVLASRVTKHGVDMVNKAQASAAAASTQDWMSSTMASTMNGIDKQRANEIVPQTAEPLIQKSNLQTEAPTIEPSPLEQSNVRQTESPIIEEKHSPSLQNGNGEFNNNHVKPSVERIRDEEMGVNVLEAHDNTIFSKSLDEDERYDRLKEGQRVPATRVGRAFGFASLGAGLALWNSRRVHVSIVWERTHKVRLLHLMPMQIDWQPHCVVCGVLLSNWVKC